MTLRMLGVGVFNFCCLLVLFQIGSPKRVDAHSPYSIAIYSTAMEIACLLGIAYWVRCYERHPGRKTSRGLLRVEIVAFAMFTLQCMLGIRIVAAYSAG